MSVRHCSRRLTGPAQREAWRRLLFSTIAPLGRIVENELRVKLDTPDLRLTWNELRASDLAGRARAFQSMVNGGIEVGKAAGLCRTHGAGIMAQTHFIATNNPAAIPNLTDGRVYQAINYGTANVHLEEASAAPLADSLNAGIIAPGDFATIQPASGESHYVWTTEAGASSRLVIMIPPS